MPYAYASSDKSTSPISSMTLPTLKLVKFQVSFEHHVIRSRVCVRAIFSHLVSSRTLSSIHQNRPVPRFSGRLLQPKPDILKPQTTDTNDLEASPKSVKPDDKGCLKLKLKGKSNRFELRLKIWFSENVTDLVTCTVQHKTTPSGNKAVNPEALQICDIGR